MSNKSFIYKVPADILGWKLYKAVSTILEPEHVPATSNSVYSLSYNVQSCVLLILCINTWYMRENTN